MHDHGALIIVHSLIFLHSVESPGRINRSTYIRCHISTSGYAQFVAERVQIDSMGNSSLDADKQVVYFDSTVCNSVVHVVQL